MRVALRRVGNSSAVILPKPILKQLGVDPDGFDLTVEEGRLVLAPTALRPRAGWAEAAKDIATAGDDKLVWPEFGNREDSDLEW
jgi:antitoxin MazE